MSPQENKDIGKRLREIRLNANLTRAEVSKALDVTEDHYRKLETGIYTLDVQKVINLYRFMGADPLYLLTGVTRNKFFYDMETIEKKPTSFVMQDLLMYCYENSSEKDN